MSKTARLAVDIGGTFTDLVLALPDRSLSTKVLTTPEAPERAVLDGTATILAQAGIAASDLALVIHGTTLATNALIERKGAKTALVTTEGFRDSLEMAYEHRFERCADQDHAEEGVMQRHQSKRLARLRMLRTRRRGVGALEADDQRGDERDVRERPDHARGRGQCGRAYAPVPARRRCTSRPVTLRQPTG